MGGQSFFGLTETVKNSILESKSISSLYDWQEDCLRFIEKLTPKNVLYTAPTSGGKTLVAEIMCIKELLVNKKNVIFILPFVSIVHEKVQGFAALALKLGYLVEEYAGSKGKIPPIKRKEKRSIYICTMEKSLVVINSLLEENRLSELGLAVVDELHLIGEKSRGPILENALLKLLLGNIRVIGMSATIGNPDSLAQFLNGVIYSSSFRPTELKEYVVVKDEVFKIDYSHRTPIIKFSGNINTGMICHLNGKRLDYPELVHLLIDFIPSRSCLIFCPTKKGCESICKIVCSILSAAKIMIENVNMHEKLILLKALTEEGNGRIDSILKTSIKFGVAYHHSGLTFPERKLLEESFTEGTLCCLCCTSTLAAGVNLPAQRVIIRSPFVGSDFISNAQYKQMAGRAGRAGYGSLGEVYTLCTSERAREFWQMLSQNIQPVQSKITIQDLAELSISLLYLNLVKTKNDLVTIMKKTFLYISLENADVSILIMIDSALKTLQPFYKINGLDETICLTPVGNAVAKGNVPIHIANDLENDLDRALEHMVLISDLHILYLISPPSICTDLNVNYDTLTMILSKLEKNDRTTANAIGINEYSLQKLMCGLPAKNMPKRTINKFIIALILHRLMQGENVWNVAENYYFDRGFINNLLQASASSCSSVIRFCQALKKYNKLQLILEPFPEKIAFSCTGDLIPLLQLPGVRMARAKQLFEAGFRTPADIAKCNYRTLADTIPHLRLKQAKEIICVAKVLVLGESEALREEAEALMIAVNL